MKRAVSVLAFLLVAAVTAWALVARPPGPAAEGLAYESWLAWELAPGEEIDLLLPADAPRVRLVTRALLPPEVDVPPGDPFEYAVDTAWIDDADHTRMARRFHEQTGISELPSPTATPWRNAWLPNDERTVTDDRVTLLPGGRVLPEGGRLRVSAPEEGPALLIRAYGEEYLGTVDASLVLFGPTAFLRDQLLRRVGFPTWELLHRGERAALSDTVWRTLRPSRAESEHIQPRWLMRSDFRLSLDEQRLGGATLPPGRKVALNLVGPVEVRVSGDPSAAALEASLITALEGDLEVRPGRPLGLQGETFARRYLLPAGPVSLVLSNPTDEAIGPFLYSVDGAHPEQLFGYTEGAHLADLAPPTAPEPPQAVLIAPEWNRLDAFAVGPDLPPLAWEGSWPAEGDVLRLLVRAHLDDFEDRAPRVVEVVARDAAGQVVWTDATAVVPEPTPFEYVIGDRGPLGEPAEVYIPVDARIARIEIDSSASLAVMLHARGAPQGDPDLYPLGSTDVRVRYPRRPVSQWRSLQPAEPAAAVAHAVQVAANVRLEPDPWADGTTRHYTSVEPSGWRAAWGRTWLLPADLEDPRERLLYCRQGPGDAPFARGPEAVERLDGVLAGALWSPGDAALGEPWRVELDDRPWQAGRLLQRVYRFRTGRTGPRSTARLVGPPGTTLWLRTWGTPGEACPDPWRALRAWPLDPGETMTFEVGRTMPRQLFVLGGLASDHTVLQVTVDDGGGVLATGLHGAWTRRERELELAPTGEQGVLLDDPATRAQVLEPRGIVLASNLADERYRITVQNTSGGRVHVRAALQVPEPVEGDPGIDEAGLIRVEGGP